METTVPKKTFFVLFGSTGDLSQRKVLPALYHLYQSQSLPKNISILAIGRTQHTNESYKDFITSHVEKILNETPSEDFLNYFTYIQGSVQDESLYARVEDELNKHLIGADDIVVAYLSVSAELYTPIALGITAHTSICKRPQSQFTVCIEKPLGSNLESAQKLHAELTAYFKEPQIYRIEHYLAKPFIKHVPVFRFKEALYEDLFNNKHVNSIEVFFSEKMGVDNRGSFYDAVGAFRDVGQNHCLHMLTSICAEKPKLDSALSESEARAEFLETALLATDESIRNSLRAQHEGYTAIAGVLKDSQTETAFKITSQLRGQRWSGVPVTYSGGKRLAEYKKGVLVTFGKNEKNIQSIYFESYPKVRTVITFTDSTTHVGFATDVAQVQYVGEYSTILHEVFNGTTQYSISEREVEAMWKFTDPYIEGWLRNVVPLLTYAPESNIV
ncbi:MAG: hypothetical protein WAX38_04205 [Minisyncoccia bacterium]